MAFQDPAGTFEDSAIVETGGSSYWLTDLTTSWMGVAFVVVMAILLFGLRDLDDSHRQRRVRAKARAAVAKWRSRPSS